MLNKYTRRAVLLYKHIMCITLHARVIFRQSPSLHPLHHQKFYANSLSFCRCLALFPKHISPFHHKQLSCVFKVQTGGLKRKPRKFQTAAPRTLSKQIETFIDSKLALYALPRDENSHFLHLAEGSIEQSAPNLIIQGACELPSNSCVMIFSHCWECERADAIFQSLNVILSRIKWKMLHCEWKELSGNRFAFNAN